jgi:hypothetical protein
MATVLVMAALVWAGVWAAVHLERGLGTVARPARDPVRSRPCGLRAGRRGGGRASPVRNAHWQFRPTILPPATIRRERRPGCALTRGVPPRAGSVACPLRACRAAQGGRGRPGSLDHPGPPHHDAGGAAAGTAAAAPRDAGPDVYSTIQIGIT